jgi:hypothetical protein
MTYFVLAEMFTGVAKFACCQPDAVSPEKVTLPSFAPVADHKFPM